MDAGPTNGGLEDGERATVRRSALEVALSATPYAPRAARAAVRMLASLAADEEQELRADLELLVSELVTNSLRHAGLEQDDLIHVRVNVGPARVRVEVVDPGRRFGPRAAAAHVRSAPGWGLELVSSLSARWGVERGPSTVVWFEVDRR